MPHFVHISDTHIHPSLEYAAMRQAPLLGARAVVAAINALPFTPDFVLHTGDVAYDPDPVAYEAVREAFAALRVPIHYLPGNHDDSAALQRVLLGREAAEVAPFYHANISTDDLQVLIVDSNGPIESPRGFIPTSELEWLAAQLEAQDERPLVVATHHLPHPTGVPWLDQEMLIANWEAFHALLAPARPRLRCVLYGHIHHVSDAVRAGVWYASAPSTWYGLTGYPGMSRDHDTHDPDAQAGFNIVSITPEQTLIRRHQFRVSP